MEKAEEQKQCQVCEQLIFVSKFRLHETQCARNNTKCEKCGKVILKADKDQHMLDEHTEKACSLCKTFKTLDAKQMMKHTSEQCLQRVKKCTYCPAQETADKYE